eukprot:6188246-Pleurochrysis_carterae.AAC.4
MHRILRGDPAHGIPDMYAHLEIKWPCCLFCQKAEFKHKTAKYSLRKEPSTRRATFSAAAGLRKRLRAGSGELCSVRTQAAASVHATCCAARRPNDARRQESFSHDVWLYYELFTSNRDT